MADARTLAFATSSAFPEATEDDRLVWGPLARLGIRAEPAIWNASEVDWSRYDAVVLRSTWDYFEHHPEFLDWVDRIERTSRLINPASLVRWNSHKRYLADLAAEGTNITPTELVAPTDRRSLGEIARSRGWTDLIVKPAIGGNAYKLASVRSSEIPGSDEVLRNLQRSGTVLVQPWLARAETVGERSLVFFGGEFSHAVRYENVLHRRVRTPVPIAPSPPEMEEAHRTLASLPAPAVYARLDYLPAEPDGWALGELEVIEPELFLRTDPAAPTRFASALAEALRG